LFNATAHARNYVAEMWVRTLEQGNADPIVIDSLPPHDRERALKSANLVPLSLLLADFLGPGVLPCATPASTLTVVAAAGDTNVERSLALPEFDKFRTGDLVRADRDVFWAP